ncbi:ABC transporter permease [Mucilaginibacter sp. L3T2-6]|uniref:ABC transporter permease n=1 Tax=Mucilaginibacter sp. L3T2-6 TaxID=3062491 RepID=UPI0026744A8D|nr:ABC transporter permease [Mucilaginibacter sp. L3T2-6]MDO3643987.1 ABC transporter permease [Mucilaginibacter sp. L3T2-6]MDV6216438.1 ABC transporter permease [Mucilaginibacter sp. L3T2-6]
MIVNYLKTAYRSLLKNKSFTALNIAGLSLGLISCLLIVFYVVDELSYDRYNTKANRIYRVNEDLKLGENNVLYAVAMPPLAKTLKAEFPYVENTVRIKNAGSLHVKLNNSSILENGFAFADPSLFDVFTLPVINGNPKIALAEPNSVVITESTAQKYFKSTNVLGKFIPVDGNTLLKITGVIKDIPKQSHFKFDFFISMSSFKDSESNEWLRSDYNTYVLFKNAADHKKLEAALPAFLKKFSGDDMRNQLHQTMSEFEKGGSFFRLNLTPLTDIHLKSNRTGELGPNSTIQYIYIFSAIALFILLIACVNFMNLSTARSANRAREVGVRKVLGSAKKHLIAQFLVESILVTFAATIIAVVLAALLLPAFNQLSGKDLVITNQTLIWLIPTLLCIVFVIGALAGSYPAFYLSAFQPIQVLKGRLAVGFKGSKLRSFLVVLQFSISIFLIIGTLVIYNQLHYIQNRDLGYNRNQILIVNNTFELGDQAHIFKNEVKQLPGVADATMTGFLPTSGWKNTAVFFKDAVFDQKKALFPQVWEIDEDYVKTLGMKMAAGRSFSHEMLTDSSGVIINQAAARFLGLTHPLNQTLYRSNGGDQTVANSKKYHIIGVVKDFNFSSLRDVISPMVLVLGNNNNSLSIKVSTVNLPSLMRQITDKWKSLSPGVQMNFSFMDQDFEASYRTEQRVGTIFILFTSLAIVIACLGLFGLAAYAAEQRTKEIGIRKILGASVSAITGMLSYDFIKLVLIAILIALPAGWYSMTKWLQSFAYRENIHWWVPLLAGFAAVFIALITVSYQSVKAALSNPVNSLRAE